MTASPSFLLMSILQNLRAGKRTTALLILGFAVGWLLPAALLASARHELFALRDRTMPDARRIIRLEELPGLSPPSVRDVARRSEAEMFAILRDLDPGVESVSFRSEYRGILSDGRSYRFVQIQSVDPAYTELFRQYFRSGGITGEGRACVVGTGLSAELWGGSGIGRNIRAGAVFCTVTGETGVQDRRVMIVETEEGSYRGWTQFFVKVKENADTDRILGKIRQAAGNDWKVERMDEVERREWSNTLAAYAAAILISLATLLFALLNIGNIMGLMVRERRKQHGIRLALGARPRTIRAELAGELIVVTTASLLLVFAVLLAVRPLAERHVFAMRLDPAVMLSVFAFNLLICCAAGLVLTRRLRKPDIVRLVREVE